MTNFLRERRTWILWLTIVAVVAAIVGIYFYYSMFRQSETELIEIVPTDAAFVIEVNDYDQMVSNSSLTANLNELFATDALPAFVAICSKIANSNSVATISGHATDAGMSTLYSIKADKAAFKILLRSLNIDPNNYKSFENNKIYTHGTNFKSMKFAFVNNVITFSENIELLKHALVQQRHPKKLLSNKDFKAVYSLTDKNKKQNWLIVNNVKYSEYLKTFFNQSFFENVSDVLNVAEWSAYQMRQSNSGILFSGYAFLNNAANKFSSNQTGDGFDIMKYLPYSVPSFSVFEVADAKSLKNTVSDSSDEALLNKLYSIVHPKEIASFSVVYDTLCARYVALLADTMSDFSPLQQFLNEESASATPIDGVFPIAGTFASVFKALADDTLRYFTLYDDAAIFSSSKENLLKYRKLISSVENISQNMSYKIISESVASNSFSLRVMFNDKNTGYFMSQLSDKGKSSKIAGALRAFSLSATPPDGKYLPINLYLSF